VTQFLVSDKSQSQQCGNVVNRLTKMVLCLSARMPFCNWGKARTGTEISSPPHRSCGFSAPAIGSSSPAHRCRCWLCFVQNQCSVLLLCTTAGYCYVYQHLYVVSSTVATPTTASALCSASVNCYWYVVPQLPLPTTNTSASATMYGCCYHDDYTTSAV
jgi:hypothetical protein